MRHVHLTCLHHPELRWQCKSIAVDALGRYNGARNIFFLGFYTGNDDGYSTDRTVDGKLERARECLCSASDLRFAPEETPLTEAELKE